MTRGIRNVEIGSLTPLEQVLTRFLLLNEQIATEWKWKDIPWWYNERASLSVLAAATRKSGGIAFEEYSTKKRYKQSTYSGRNDLYMKPGKIDYIVEAKIVFAPCYGKRTPATSVIAEQLQRAARDVKLNKPYGAKRLAVVFAIPWLRASAKTSAEQRIHLWLSGLRKIRCSARGWIFPSRALRFRGEKDVQYPGIAILLKTVH